MLQESAFVYSRLEERELRWVLGEGEPKKLEREEGEYSNLSRWFQDLR